MYHPDVAGAAGAAMTLRLNDAQRVLLDPELRSRVDRPGSHSAAPFAKTDQTAHFARDFPKPTASYRPSARPAAVTQRNITRDTVAIVAIAVILVSTIAVFAFVYSAPVASITPRVIPPIVIALVWMAVGLSRPPRFTYPSLGASMLLWPLALSGAWPFTALVGASPTWVWATLTASFVAMIALRLAAPPVSRYRSGRSAPRRTAPRRATVA